MKLTAKGYYGLVALADLARHSSGEAVRLQEISDRQGISIYFLEQLFRKLRQNQIVKSVRGPGGGYVLARQLNEISVRDILNGVGENTSPFSRLSADSSDTPEAKKVKEVLSWVDSRLHQALIIGSLADFLKSDAEKDPA